jgi:hypothetical protein
MELALVIVTGALALFTGAMAFFTRRAVEAGKRTADSAEKDIAQGAELVRIGQDQVQEAQRQADLALSALEADRQPVLVATTTREPWNPESMLTHHYHGLVSQPIQDFPVGKCWIEPNSTTAWVVVKVRNVGRGTAFIDDLNTAAIIDLNGNGEVPGDPYSATIAPDDRMFIAFAGQPNQSGSINTLHTWVTVGNPFTVTIRYSDITRHRSFTTYLHYGTARPDPNVTQVLIVED